MASDAMEVEGAVAATIEVAVGGVKGVPHYMTPDLLAALPPACATLNVLVDVADVLGCLKVLAPLVEGNGAEFAGANGTATLAEAAGVAPHIGGLWLTCTDPEHLRVLPFTASDVVLAGNSGRMKVDADALAKVVSAIKPSVALDLYPTITAECGSKRQGKCVDMMKRNATQKSKWHGDVNRRVFPVPLGSLAKTNRKVIDAAASAVGGVDGYAVIGAGNGVPRSRSIELLRFAASMLQPLGKTLMLHGCPDPFLLLDAVSLGYRMFTTTFAEGITREGSALSFDLTEGAEEKAAQPLKFSLWDRSLELDARSLKKGCPCYTCRDHSRAYIHHLLRTHEMLAQILLHVHNLSQLLLWVAEINKHLVAGTFEQWKEWWITRHT